MADMAAGAAKTNQTDEASGMAVGAAKTDQAGEVSSKKARSRGGL